MFGSPGTPASASAGTSAAMPHQPPVHTGRSGSPASNWTQTPAPTCGTMNVPICLPAIGTQGIAQVDGVMPPTSGHDDHDPAELHRVDVVDDRAAIDAVVLVACSLIRSPSETEDPMPPRASVKLCLYSPRLMLCVTLFT